MKSKIYYIGLIINSVLSYNNCWGDILPNSKLVNNTEEAINELQDYCTLIKNHKDCIKNDFLRNPKLVQEIVKEIINIVWGNNVIIREIPNEEGLTLKWGKSCRKDKDGNNHNVHAEDNKYLKIENDPQESSKRILNFIKDLFEIIESEKHTINVDKYLHRWYSFPGYENGPAYIYISKIDYKNGHYVFTGGHVYLTTENTYGDGVLVNDVEDYDFGNLPYTNKLITYNELIETLEKVEETTLDVIKAIIIDSLNNYWFNNKDFSYDIEKHVFNLK